MAAETTMSEHIASFWRLLETEHVRIIVDMLRNADSVPYWDSSSFPNSVGKALVADRAIAAALVDSIRSGGDVNERLRAVILNIQALAETGQPIDAAKLATRCRHALTEDSSRPSVPK